MKDVCPIIDIKNLEKIYRDEETETRALSDISFSINIGEFVAVMGPSGSGKSTLLHILGFLDTPTGGEYVFDGKNMSLYSKNELAEVRNKKMGFVFQSFNLLAKTSVLENVKLPLLYSNVKEAHWNRLAEKAIKEVGLEHRAHHKTSELSGGERQRVAIARALINNPEVIFADEPTGNLDSKSGKLVMETIERLNDEGRTVILITHETYTAEHAKRILHIKDGTLASDTAVTHRRRAKDAFEK